MALQAPLTFTLIVYWSRLRRLQNMAQVHFAPHETNLKFSWNFERNLANTYIVKLDLHSITQHYKWWTNFELTWTAQLRKQLFWPGPLSSPFVSVSWWCCIFDGDEKKFIGKFLIIGDWFDDAMCGWNVVPIVILLVFSRWVSSLSRLVVYWFLTVIIICERSQKIICQFRSIKIQSRKMQIKHKRTTKFQTLPSMSKQKKSAREIMPSQR